MVVCTLVIKMMPQVVGSSIGAKHSNIEVKSSIAFFGVKFKSSPPFISNLNSISL